MARILHLVLIILVALHAVASVTKIRGRKFRKQLEDFIKNNSKAVIMFKSNRCQPCRVMSPAFEEVSREYTDFKFAMTTRYPSEYKIRGLPTVLFFINGNEVKRVVGGSWTQAGNKRKLIRNLKAVRKNN